MSQQRTSSPFPAYIPALDGLRGFAVLAVIALHLAWYAEVDGGVTWVAYSIARFGWVGVDLFFVLSGFLITGILFDNQGGRTWVRAFYGRRFLRIIPIYFFLLALYAAIAPIFAAPAETQALYSALPWHAAFLTNIRVTLAASWAAAPMNTQPLWTLAVEEQFYLLWPMIVALAARFSRSPRRSLMWLSGGLVIYAFVFRLVLVPDFPYAAYTLLPARMDALAIGAFIALWARGPGGVTGAVAAARPTILLCCVGLLVIAIPTAGTHSNFHPLQQSLGYTLWALAFGGLVILAATSNLGRLGRSLTVAPLQHIGRISYGLYLIHCPVIWILYATGWRAPGFTFFSAAAVVISVGLAHLSWRFVESPILALKRYFPYDSAGSPGFSNRALFEQVQSRRTFMAPQKASRKVPVLDSERPALKADGLEKGDATRRKPIAGTETLG